VIEKYHTTCGLSLSNRKLRKWLIISNSKVFLWTHKKQEGAQWKARESDEELPPYVLREPLQQNSKPNASPMEHILYYFNTWTKRAEERASNIWHNCTHLSSLFFFLNIVPFDLFFLSCRPSGIENFLTNRMNFRSNYSTISTHVSSFIKISNFLLHFY